MSGVAVVLVICTYMMGWAVAGPSWSAARPHTSFQWQAKRALCWPLEPLLLPAGYLLSARRRARAQDVATLERAEAVLTALDDEPPPLPPAIPMEMRDPAFQRRDAELERLKRQAVGWNIHERRLRAGVDRVRSPLMRRRDLQNEPLVADRRFTLLTHCQHGHVATHWLGRVTTDHIERICRFERCAATWLERT